jgi:hypothetical protein
MKKFAIVVMGLLVSTGVQAGKPGTGDVTCPCEFTVNYCNEVAEFGPFTTSTLQSSKGKDSLTGLWWGFEVGPIDYGVVVFGKLPGEWELYCVYNSSQSNPEPTLFVQNLARGEYRTCRNELKDILDDIDAAPDGIGICD